MNKKNIVRQLAYMFLPAILFKLVQSRWGLMPAMVISLSVSLYMMARHYKAHRRVNNSLVIGLCATVLALVGYLFSDNERFYFIPAMLTDIVFILVILVCMKRKQCYVHLFLKDFHNKYLEEMEEKSFFSINYLWLALFVVRLGIRTVTLFWMELSFDSLYWISFFTGDPITLPVIAYTFFYFRNRVNRHYDEHYRAKTGKAKVE